MAISGASGSFSVPAADTTNIVVSGLSGQPQWVRFWTCNINGTGSSAATVRVSRGITDGTRSFATAISIADNVASDQSRSYTRSDSVVLEMDGTTSLTGRLAISTLNSDGFTLTVPDAFVGTATVHWEAGWGHTNVYVEARQWAASTGNWSSTAPGFQPDAIHTMSSQSTALNTSSNGMSYSEGFATGSGAQGCVVYRGEFTAVNNYTWDLISTASMAFRMSSGTVDRELRLVSLDATGYTFNQIAGTNQYYIGILSLKGGGSYAVVTGAAQSGTGTFGVTATGVVPTMVLGVGAPERTATMTAGAEGGNLTFGAITPSGQQGMMFLNDNRETLGLTDTFTRTWTDRFLCHYVRSGADTLSVQGEIQSSSFGDELVTLNQSDGDPTAGLFLLLVMGSTYSASSFPIVTRPRFGDLTFGVHVKKRVLGFRSGLSFATAPLGATADTTKAVKPYAKMLTRKALSLAITKGRTSSLEVLGTTPIVGVPGSGGAVGIVYDIIIRRRIVRR